MDPIPLDLLEALAAEAPADAKSSGQNVHLKPATAGPPRGGNGVDIDGFMRQHFPDAQGPGPWQGGRRWKIDCPWRPDEHKGSGFVLQLPSGAISAGCLHDSCRHHTWQDLRRLREPGCYDRPAPSSATAPPAGNAESEAEPAPPVEIISVTQLLADFPELRPSVVRGLLREGESLNLIAAAKSNKTYSAIDLALCIVTGRMWLGRFQIERPGPVLYVDAELHPNTLAKRLRDVAAARGIVRDEYKALDTVSLRGRIRDLAKLGPSLFWKIPARKYVAIFLDALYRFQPERFDENSNSDVTKLYNLIDTYAEAAGAAFVIVHHSSKGNQAGKSVVDVGSGASAMARAADGHLVLRPHKDDGVFVLEGAVRSWPPVDPFCLRWTYPVWTPEPDLDPADLLQPGPRRRQKEDAPKLVESTPVWTDENFASAFIRPAPVLRATIIAKARAQGMGKSAAENLVRLGLESGRIHVWRMPKTNAVYLASKPQEVTP
jgi:hypothetical protein